METSASSREAWSFSCIVVHILSAGIGYYDVRKTSLVRVSELVLGNKSKGCVADLIQFSYRGKKKNRKFLSFNYIVSGLGLWIFFSQFLLIYSKNKWVEYLMTLKAFQTLHWILILTLRSILDSNWDNEGWTWEFQDFPTQITCNQQNSWFQILYLSTTDFWPYEYKKHVG